MTVKISLTGLVDYMTGSPTEQRRLLEQYKYPKDDEPRAKILYYREAKERVQGFHRASREPEWLIQQADALETLAQVSTGRGKTRLKHNARTLLDYHKHFSGREFEVLEGLKLSLEFGKVIVSVVPDLHVRERGKEKIIKLHLGVEGIDEEQVHIYSQAMFEASQVADLKLPSSGILVFDLSTGAEHKGARLGSRMRKHLESACLNIAAIWESI